jgi:ADP-heptose:LPS heptosyltransferase
VQASLRRGGLTRVLACPPFPPAGERIHAADWLLRSLAPLGVAGYDSWEQAPWLPAEPADARAALAALAAAGGARPPGRYALLHPGSGSGRKNWPAPNWREVVRALGIAGELVVVAGPADDAALAALEAAWADAGWARPRVLPPLRLGTLAGVLAQAALYLGNDSGVSHLAAAGGAPSVAVFGPTDPAIWRPRGPHVRALGGSQAPASALFAPVARWPAVEEVIAAATALLATR